MRDHCTWTGAESFNRGKVERGNVRKQWRILMYSTGPKCAFFEGAPLNVVDGFNVTPRAIRDRYNNLAKKLKAF